MTEDHIPVTLAEFEDKPWRKRVPWQKADLMHGRIAIPPRMQDPLADYVEHGRPIGGFLTALLGNDLCGAVKAADSENRLYITDYVLFLYNYAPAPCYGSPEAVATWQEQGGLVGRLSRNAPPPPRPPGWNDLTGSEGEFAG